MAQAIPTYMMSIFRIPDGILDEIQMMLARFWWGSKRTERKLHWHKWESLCLPKSMGEMGFRDLKCFNQDLIEKQGWRLYNTTDSLIYKVLKARYFKNTEFLEARRGNAPSYSWRSIWGAKSLLLEGLKWRVGNGTKIKVWEDDWVPGDDNYMTPTRSSDSNLDIRVADLIDFWNGCWVKEKMENTFSEYEGQQVLNIPLSRLWPCDKRF